MRSAVRRRSVVPLLASVADRYHPSVEEFVAHGDEVRGRLAELGHSDDDLDKALAAWAGIENYEERLLPGRIDPVVLEQLRLKSS